MTQPSESPGHLADAVRRRMAELGVSGPRLDQADYISRATLTRVLRGGHETLRNPSGLERGLGWADGSIEAVVQGGDPVEVIDAETVRWPRRDGDWRAAIEEAWADRDAALTTATEPDKHHDRAAWMTQQTADWPAWLADRVRAVLEDHGDDDDLAGLVARVIPTDRLPEVIRVVERWKARDAEQPRPRKV